MKLHAALVLNITFWAIYEPRRDTKRSGCSKGFNDRVSLITDFSLPATRREKSLCIEAKLRRNYD